MRQRRGTILEAVVTDGRDTLSLTFFNQKWREGTLRAGRRGLFSGQVTRFRGVAQLTHPEFILLPDGAEEDPLAALDFAGALLPIYPSAKAVTSWQLQKAVDMVIGQMGELLDPIPGAILAERGLCSLTDAFWGIHRPTSNDDVDRATERLRFEEAFVLQVVLAQRRLAVRAQPATRRVPASSPLETAFDARLPFALTRGQLEVAAEIEADLAQDHPMHRLLQGDVGSGKTVVALRAMLRVVDAGGQAALLAPTEVLAAQHLRSITELLGPLGRQGQLGGADVATRVALLTGSQSTSRRRRELLEIVTGDAGIVIGTHALLQEHVDFYDLALVVVDEQHRFGVEQRAALAAKARDGSRPHVLVMTATPIPRTIAMTVFGDVDVSTLAELPSGRAPITTHVVSRTEHPGHVERAWQRAREEVALGHRVFVVCPRIGPEDDESAFEADFVDEDTDPAGGPSSMTSVLPLARSLAEGALAGLRVGVMHGRLSGEDKDDVMRRFADTAAPDGIDVLVSTTVIEVGVDVPAATMMVVMDAERFGISQLHQLRGRVARGGLPGLCLLVTGADVGSPGRHRLDAVALTTDGFALSDTDLQMRREGDVLGSIQSGRRSSLRLLEVSRHEDVILDARSAAATVVDSDPGLEVHPALADAVDYLVREDQSEFLDKA
jgi:ATP-dependent DNA helicase RecG